jgi:hypothetical protein
MRFRPANIRVINRRARRLDRFRCCRRELDRVVPYQTDCTRDSAQTPQTIGIVRLSAGAQSGERECGFPCSERTAATRQRWRRPRRPQAALPREGAHAARTNGAPFVMTSVCSQCAARLPSRVRMVQPSSSCTGNEEPALIIGSIVRTRPSVRTSRRNRS